MDTLTIKIPQFEGPLELLATLALKAEVEVSGIEIKHLMQQILSKLDFSRSNINISAESMSFATQLLWLKSRSLLPNDELPIEMGEDSSDFRVSYLEHLVEYCLYKEAARHLNTREDKAQESFTRMSSLGEPPKRPLGIEHVSLSEFAVLFQQVLQKAEEKKGTIHEEEYRVSDKLEWIRLELKETKQIPFHQLFSPDYPKLELIVFFLAILELMKLGEILVVKDTNTQVITIISNG